MTRKDADELLQMIERYKNIVHQNGFSEGANWHVSTLNKEIEKDCLSRIKAFLGVLVTEEERG